MIQITLIGRLTRDPEVKATQSGDTFTSFSLACSKGKDETMFFDCTVWGERGKPIEAWCKKGHQLMVQGMLGVNEYESPKTGEKRFSLKVMVNQFEFLTSKKEAEQIMNQKSGTVPEKDIQVAEKNEKSYPDQELPEVDIDSIKVQMPF